MKGLVQFIKEGVDKMLHDLKELIPETDWDKCDRMDVDDVLQLIVDTLGDYGEKTSKRLTELDSFNKMKKYSTVLVAAYDNDASDVADELASYVDEDCLFAKKSCCIYSGNNIDIYFQQFKDIMIGAMRQWDNGTNFDWTFFIASDKI